MLDPAKAKSAGLVDAVVPADELLQAAKEWVLNARPRRHRQAMGPEGLQDARRCALSPGRFHDLRRRQRHDPRQDQGRLPGGQGAAFRRLRRRLGRLRHRAADRGALFHPSADGPVLLGHDPVAVPEQGSAGEGRKPPLGPGSDREEGRHPRRGHDGRRHRLCLGHCRDRGCADRRRDRTRPIVARPIPKACSTRACSARR